MLHVLTAINADMGTSFVSSAGVSAPAADYFSIEVKGRGCHGSAPWKGVDALTVSARILLGLQELSARELPISDRAVLTVGALQSGEAGNALSDRTVLRGTMRAFDENTRAFVKECMEQIARQIAKAFRAKAKVVYGGGCPTLVNDEKLSHIAENAAKELLGSKAVFTSNELGADIRKNSGGSEDFAYIAQAVPAVMIGLAAGEKGNGYEYPLHHPKAKFDENALCVGAALYAKIAQKYFGSA